MSESFILMHISDLHFHRLPRHPAAYASKRLLGALNLALRRRREFPLERAQALVRHLAGQPWDHLLITGDVTQLGTRKEFELARRVLAPLLEAGAEKVTVLPGNHDRYVPEPAGRGAFEAVFGDLYSGASPRFRHLTGHWWLACWDSAQPAPWHSAAGRVPAETLRQTALWLEGLPDGARTIVANHYPAHYPAHIAGRRNHGLLNQEEVERWMNDHPVDLYLHGHIHQNWVLEIPVHGRTLTAVNSAASTAKPRHSRDSAYHRIVLAGEKFRIEPQHLETRD